MRKYVILKQPINDIHKLMIYSSEDGCYLFFYDSIEDKQCINDHWFENFEDAETLCKDDYNIEEAEWVYINDPIEYCQHDYIKPLRVKGRNLNKPEWGKFEELVNNQWIEVNMK